MPNLGLPIVQKGKTVYLSTPQQMADQHQCQHRRCRLWTTPTHIRAFRQAIHAC